MRISQDHTFARSLIARTIAADDPVGFARSHWGAASDAVLLLEKTAVGGLTSASPMSHIGSADDAFFGTVLDASILGKIRYREVPFNVRLLRSTSPARGYWVSESKPIPMSLQALTGSSLPRRKVAAIILATLEGLKAASPLAVQRLEDDLRGALVGVLDEAFIDATNAGAAGERPAAVTYGAPSQISSGDPSTDLAALVAGFAGDLAQAVLITHPVTAVELALARDAAGGWAFPDCGPRGGSILGLPVLTSGSSPRGQLALLDPSGVAAQLEKIEISRSTQTTLEMSDSPTGAADTPVAMSKTIVNLFQTDSVAFKAILHANWESQRAAASVITNAIYGGT